MAACGQPKEEAKEETEKLVLIFGATGQQGGSVIKNLVASKKGWKIRAVTRDPTKERAKKLGEIDGVTVVKGDQNDLDSKLFDGVTHLYLVTNFWADCKAETEMKQLTAAVKCIDNCKTLQHIVYSTLEDYRKSSVADKIPTLEGDGDYKVAHFDVKGSFDEKMPKDKTTFVRAAFYMDNLGSSFKPNKTDDGYAFALPMGDKKLPMVSVEDIGKASAAIFNDPDKYIGKYVGLSTCIHTGTEVCDAISKAYGVKLTYNAVTRDQYAAFPFPMAAEVANMFYAHALDNENFIKCRTENSPLPPPKEDTLINWLKENKDKMKWLPKE